MRYTAFNEPPTKKIVSYSDWQVDYTGSACAAALLNFFSYWHMHKLNQQTQAGSFNDTQEKHGLGRSQYEGLLQWHTENDLCDAMMGGFGRRAIRSAITTLVDLGAISIHKNPDPRCKHDQTKHFLLHPEIVNEWIKDRQNKSTGVGGQTPIPHLTGSTEWSLPDRSNAFSQNDECNLPDRSNDPIFQIKHTNKEEKGDFAFLDTDPEAIATLPEESWIAKPDPEPGTVEVSRPDPKTLSASRSIKTNPDSSNGSGLRGVKVPPPRVSLQDSSERVGQFIPTVENFFGARKQDLAYRFPKHHAAQRHGALALAHFEIPHYWVGPGAWDYAPALIKGAELHLRSLNRPTEQKDCAKWIATRVGNLTKPQESAAALLALEHAYAEGERWSKAIAAYEAARMPVEARQSISEGDRLPDSSGGDSGAPRGAGKLDLSGLDRIIKGGGLRLESKLASEEVRCA